MIVCPYCKPTKFLKTSMASRKARRQQRDVCFALIMA